MSSLLDGAFIVEPQGRGKEEHQSPLGGRKRDVLGTGDPRAQILLGLSGLQHGMSQKGSPEASALSTGEGVGTGPSGE